MTKLNMDIVCQIAVVVNDLDEGLEAFRDLFGIDESSVTFSDSRDAYAEGRLKDVMYNGVEGEYHYVQKNFYMGGMDIEMFAPIPEYKDEKNPFTDFLKENGGPGIHHLNIRMVNREEGVNHIEKDLGIVPLYDVTHLGRNCKYYDFREQLGLVIEYGMRLVGPRATYSEDELKKLSAYR